MGTPKNHPVPQTMSDWMRSQEKRVMHEERRPRITKASDLLGPGFAPTATHLLDWNSEEARFNGFFHSANSADNSPGIGGVMSWMGLVISSGNHGQQIVWSHGGPEMLVMHRYFHVHENSMPVFGAWEALGGGVEGATTLAELVDVALADLAEGDVLRYTTLGWVNAALSRADIVDFDDHDHDDRYYTESEVDLLLASKPDEGHTHTKSEITDFAHTHSLDDLTAGVLGVPLVMDALSEPDNPPAGSGVWWTGLDGRPHFKNSSGGEIILDPITGHIPTEAPQAAPTVQVLSGSGAAVVRWTAVEDATEYELHVHPGVPAAEEGDPNTAPTTPPDAETLHTPNANSPTWVTHIDPQGSAASVPTEEGQEAYFAIVPRNSFGPGPASAWVPGLAGQINPAILSASLAVVQQVIAEIVETQGLSIGGQTWNNEDGLTIPGVLNFPVGGGEASILAHLVAQSLTILDNLSIRGTDNEVAKGATITLESGMTAPKAGPKFSASTDVRATHGGFEPRGFAYHSASGRFWRVESIYRAVLQALVDNTGSGGGYDFGWSNCDLTTQRSEITSGLGGVAFVGNNAYVLCETNVGWPGTYVSRYYVYKFAWQGWSVPDPHDRWLYVERFPYLTETDGSGIRLSPYRPCIGTDGTDLYVLRPNEYGVIWMDKYDTSGNRLSFRRVHEAGVEDAPSSYRAYGDVLGLVVSPADSGGAVAMWARFKGDSYVRAFDGGSHFNRLPAWDFHAPVANNEGGGLHWDGTRFLVAGYQQVARMSQITGGVIEATQAWRLGNPATAETDESPVSTYTPVKRQWVRLESSAPIPDDTGDPDDADSVVFYVGSQGGTRYEVLPSIPVGGTVRLIDAVPTSGNTPPLDPAPFAEGTASLIQSAGADLTARPTIELHGSGRGRVGPWEWDDVGEVVSAPNTGPLVQAGSTVVAITTANSWNNQETITFAEPFDSPPVIGLLWHPGSVPGNTNEVLLAALDVTTTGFTIICRRTNTSNVAVGWTATEATQ